MHRTQLLLDDAQNRRLREMAARKGKSISEVLRQILAEYFAWKEQEEKQEALQALRELDRLREGLATRYGIYEGEPVQEIREEREHQIEDTWKQWS